jgi:hypothetical protein
MIVTRNVKIIVDHNIYIKDFMWTNWRLCEGPLAMFFLLVVPMLLLLVYKSFIGFLWGHGNLLQLIETTACSWFEIKLWLQI